MDGKPARPDKSKPSFGAPTDRRASPWADDSVDIDPPDIGPHRAGNTGVPYYTSRDSGRPGPHVMINALIHGNELSGAVVVDRLLRSGISPALGQLTLGFANVAAFQRFDIRAPRRSRYIHRDLNRVWSPAVLDRDPTSVELDRAREIRALIDTVDILLDLHSMQTHAEPLILAGPLAKGQALAQAIGYPALIVCDAGHDEGIRLRDYGGFGDPDSPKTALLLESGQHWDPASIDVAEETCRRFLAATGMVPSPLVPLPQQRVLTVTEAVTIRTPRFRFVDTFLGMECIADAGTVIAHDGDHPVVTPYDQCVLIMPTRRLIPGQTAVRLGRYVV